MTITGKIQKYTGHLPRPDWVRRINPFGAAVGDPVRMVSLDADELATAIPTYLADKPKDKFGKHVYDPADLGLDESAVRAQFTDYIAHHNIPLED